MTKELDQWGLVVLRHRRGKGRSAVPLQLSLLSANQLDAPIPLPTWRLMWEISQARKPCICMCIFMRERLLCEHSTYECLLQVRLHEQLRKYATTPEDVLLSFISLNPTTPTA